MSDFEWIQQQSNAFFIVLSNLPQNFLFSENSLFISEPSDTNQINNCIHTDASSLPHPHPPAHTHTHTHTRARAKHFFQLYKSCRNDIYAVTETTSPGGNTNAWWQELPRQNWQWLSSQNKKTSMVTLNLQQQFETPVSGIKRSFNQDMHIISVLNLLRPATTNVKPCNIS